MLLPLKKLGSSSCLFPSSLRTAVEPRRAPVTLSVQRTGRDQTGLEKHPRCEKNDYPSTQWPANSLNTQTDTQKSLPTCQIPKSSCQLPDLKRLSSSYTKALAFIISTQLAVAHRRAGSWQSWVR